MVDKRHLLLIVLLGATSAFALEVVRQKNVATYIYFPIMSTDGNSVEAAAGLDSEIDTFGDGTAPDGFADCTNEATHIDDGWYYLSLTQAEMNFDYIVIDVNTSTPNAQNQRILIRTVVGDPLLFATTTAGSIINTSGGVVEADAVKISGDTTAANNAELMHDGTKVSVASVFSDAQTTSTLKDIVRFVLKTAIDADPNAGSVWERLKTMDDAYTATRAAYLDNINGHTAQTGDSFARIGVAGAGLTNIDLPNQTMDITGNITGNLSGSVGSVTADVGITATAVDNIWDEVLTGATHNVASSAGRRLRDVSSTFVLSEGTAQAGAAGSITLAAGESAVTDYYEHAIIVLTGGTGVGQARAISAYNGSTKVATTVPNWKTNPDVTSTYTVLADTEKHVYEVHTGAIAAAAFAAGAIDAAALATDAANEIRDTILDDATRFSGADIADILTAVQKIDSANELRTFLWGNTTALRIDSTSGAVVDANDAQFMAHGETVTASGGGGPDID